MLAFFNFYNLLSHIFSNMFFGTANKFDTYPFFSFRYEKQNITVEEYTGATPNKGSETSINLAQVVYALNPNKKPEYDSLKNEIHFYKLNEETESVESISSLRKKVEENCIVTKKYFLGTDILGRDILSRLMIGTRISLAVCKEWPIQWRGRYQYLSIA